jgi:hypothetical protein
MPSADASNVTLGWHPIQLDGSTPEQVEALAGGAALVQSNGQSELFVVDATNATDSTDGSAISAAMITGGSFTAAAISPDRTQAVVAKAASIEFEQLGSDGSWASAGSFPVAQTVSGLAYDAAGSHAVALWADTSGSGFCELH